MTLPENTNPARHQTNLSYRSANNTDDTTMPNTIDASSQQGASSQQDNNLSMFWTPRRRPVARYAAAQPSPPAQEEIHRAAKKRRARYEAEKEKQIKRSCTSESASGLDLERKRDSSRPTFLDRLKRADDTFNADASDHSQPTITPK